MSSNYSPDNNNKTNLNDDNNLKKVIEGTKEKEKIKSINKDNVNSQKSNQSLSNVLDEKEIYNIPI